MKYFFTVAALAIIVLPQVVVAKTVVRGGEAVSINDEQVIEYDFYAWGGRVSMSGQVQGDMTALGGQVAVNGNIANDLSLAGGNIQVYGNVEDDLRIVAGEAIIAGNVKGDVFAVAGSLTILSTATVEGDVIFFGGEGAIEGAVTGDIQGNTGSMRVDNTVGGINLTTGSLTLGDNAVVSGDVQYKSNLEIIRSPNANIEGSVVKNSVPVTEDTGLSLRPFLFLFLSLAASGLLLLLILRKPIIRILQPGGSSRFDVLYGLGFLLGGPLVSVVLMSTAVLGPLGFLALFGYFSVILFASIFSVIYLGTKALAWVKVKATMRGIEVIFGSLLIAFAALVPGVGMIFILIILSITIGFLLRKSVHLLK